MKWSGYVVGEKTLAQSRRMETNLWLAWWDALVKGEGVTEVNTEMPQVRRSACADAALRAEMKRVEKMTVEERMKAALSLGRRFSVVRTTNKGK